jgi:hypothetical protein
MTGNIDSEKLVIVQSLPAYFGRLEDDVPLSTLPIL